MENLEQKHSNQDSFTVTGIQIAPVVKNLEAAMEKVLFWFNKAVSEYKSDLLVFPETVFTSFSPGYTKEELYQILPTDLAEFIRPVRELCQKHDVACVLPLYERGKEENIIYNSSCLIDEDGEIAGIYRKTHLFPYERLEDGGWTTQGNSCEAFNTKRMRVGMMICFDGDFPELARMLAVDGADVLIRPSALIRDYDIWDITNRTRAYENNLPMIAVNAVGTDGAGKNYYGHSMIVAPDAHILAVATAQEELISSQISKEYQRKLALPYAGGRGVDHLTYRNVNCYNENLNKPYKRK